MAIELNLPRNPKKSSQMQPELFYVPQIPLRLLKIKFELQHRISSRSKVIKK